MDEKDLDHCGEEGSSPEAEVSEVYFYEYRGAFIERHGSKCVYCGTNFEVEERKLGKRRLRAPVVDHIKPRIKGLDNRPSNLTVCCSSCNSAKSGRDLESFLQSKGFAVLGIPTFEGIPADGFEERRKARMRAAYEAKDGLRVNIPVAGFEKDLFEAAAKEVGLSLSSWIRTVALASAKKIVVTIDDTRQ